MNQHKKGPAKTSLSSLDMVDKQLQALNLRKQGLTFEEIGAQMGAPRGSAYRWVKGGIKSILKEPAEIVRQLEIERLDAMLKAVWPKVEAGSPAHIYSALAIMDRRSKYLGLDAPTKTAFTDPEGNALPPVLIQVVSLAAHDATQLIIQGERTAIGNNGHDQQAPPSVTAGHD